MRSHGNSEHNLIWQQPVGAEQQPLKLRPTPCPTCHSPHHIPYCLPELAYFTFIYHLCHYLPLWSLGPVAPATHCVLYVNLPTLLFLHGFKHRYTASLCTAACHTNVSILPLNCLPCTYTWGRNKLLSYWSHCYFGLSDIHSQTDPYYNNIWIFTNFLLNRTVLYILTFIYII